jgi:hypothetical protein
MLWWRDVNFSIYIHSKWSSLYSVVLPEALLTSCNPQPRSLSPHVSVCTGKLSHSFQTIVFNNIMVLNLCLLLFISERVTTRPIYRRRISGATPPSRSIISAATLKQHGRTKVGVCKWFIQCRKKNTANQKAWIAVVQYVLPCLTYIMIFSLCLNSCLFWLANFNFYDMG